MMSLVYMMSFTRALRYVSLTNQKYLVAFLSFKSLASSCSEVSSLSLGFGSSLRFLSWCASSSKTGLKFMILQQILSSCICQKSCRSSSKSQFYDKFSISFGQMYYARLYIKISMIILISDLCPRKFEYFTSFSVGSNLLNQNQQIYYVMLTSRLAQTYKQQNTDNYLSNRQLELPLQLTKQITYENRIFNVKKKFTFPIHVSRPLLPQQCQSNEQEKTRWKPVSNFCKHIDNLQRNRQLIRRGVCQLPLSHEVVASGASKRYKTEGESNRIQLYSSVDQAKGIKKSRVRTSQHNLKASAQFPIIDYKPKSRYENNCPQNLSVDLQSMMDKFPANMPDNEQFKRMRNAVNRKLAIQIINYELLGKWATSSVKL